MLSKSFFLNVWGTGSGIATPYKYIYLYNEQDICFSKSKILSLWRFGKNRNITLGEINVLFYIYVHTEKIRPEMNNLKNENLLTLKTVNSLLEEKIKTSKFHLLPKINKANNPGRPVISFINCHTSRIC